MGTTANIGYLQQLLTTFNKSPGELDIRLFRMPCVHILLDHRACLRVICEQPHIHSDVLHNTEIVTITVVPSLVDKVAVNGGSQVVVVPACAINRLAV